MMLHALEDWPFIEIWNYSLRRTSFVNINFKGYNRFPFNLEEWILFQFRGMDSHKKNKI